MTDPDKALNCAVPPKTILVVEDEDVVIGTLTILLEDEGYQVVVARDGTKGRAAYAKIRPDIVITDIIMPNETGISLIASVNRMDPAAKVVAISGSGCFGDMNFLETAKALGANAAIAKPFDPEELLGVVRSLLAPQTIVAAAAAT